jgi:hypothetical protein
MGRDATITQADVNAVAERLHAAGTRPTNRAVREALGGGSMGTVVKFLRVWQAGQVRQSDTLVTLPPVLQRAMVDFVAHEVAAARAALEAELAIAEQTCSDLVAESERQTATLDARDNEIEGLRTECAELRGRLAQLTTDLETSQAALYEQRQAAEAARTELARLELRLEAVPKLEAEIVRLQAAREEERAGRVAAEQSAAVAAARLDNVEAQVVDLKQRLARAEAAVTHELPRERAKTPN